MALEYEFHPEAEAELVNYINQLKKDKPGDENILRQFTQEIREVAEMTAKFPEMWPKATHDPKFRKAGPTKRHDFLLYYRQRKGVLFIIAAAAPGQEPGYWVGRK